MFCRYETFFAKVGLTVDGLQSRCAIQRKRKCSGHPEKCTLFNGFSFRLVYECHTGKCKLTAFFFLPRNWCMNEEACNYSEFSTVFIY